ncbi:MAG TPA: hypothetical protein VFW98_08375 [Gemmatimonadaceae bacterium]|nr:hypothetical protein [Gemmatimonadaceae bacterium]
MADAPRPTTPSPSSSDRLLSARPIGWCLLCRGPLVEETWLVLRGGSGVRLAVEVRIVCQCA